MTGLNVGIIGLGVGEKHIDGFERSGNARVIRICDIDAAKLADVSSRHPASEITSEPLDILGDPEIDVVSIASYDDCHRDQIVRALHNGKHVFVEKPLCLTRRELEDIGATFRAAPQLKLSSNLILRRSPRFAELRDIIHRGDMGEVYYLEGDYNYGRLEKITHGWRSNVGEYSVVHSGGIHLIDLILWLTGDRVVSVTAMGTGIATRGSRFEKDDQIVALLRLASGGIAKISSNFACVFPHHHNVQVYGTAATFVQTHHGGAVMYRSRDPEDTPEQIHSPYLGTHKGDMIPAFVDAIMNGGEPEVSAFEVFDAMAVSIAIVESVETGGEVPVEYTLAHFAH